MSIPRELAATIDRLDPLPVTLQALVGKLDDDFVSPREIARLVEYDQAMVAVLLRAANSAALGGRISVERIADAVLRLGIDQILTVVMGSTSGSSRLPWSSTTFPRTISGTTAR